MKRYYDALYSNLHNALQEAEIICTGENIFLDTSNLSKFIISRIISLSPNMQKMLSDSKSWEVEIINANNIKKYAEILIGTLSKTLNGYSSVCQNIAERLTLKNKNRIETCENNPEIVYWVKQWLVDQWKDFFVNINSSLNQSKPEILGGIDTLKILYIILYGPHIRNLDLEESINQLITVITSYVFSEEKKSKKKCKCCNVFYIKEINYKYYLLNKPSLLKD